MSLRWTDRQLKQRGDDRARAELAARYLPLARRLARRYREELHQREIAERIGCSQMTISRMLRDAVETLCRCAAGPSVRHEPKSVV